MVDVPISGPARLDGQVALVTGAAGGIGREVVRSLVEAGATVIATDLGESNPYAGQANIHYARYDVTCRQQTDELAERLVREHGRIDVLVLCAGTIACTRSSTPPTRNGNDPGRQPVRRRQSRAQALPGDGVKGHGKIVALGSIAAKIGGVPRVHPMWQPNPQCTA